eukprot:TRINITY_DN1912_c0_g1_i1.p1 TRINITY_DN1912_c0_g1~~TRINITY_DN1912_c0_g1_i1.p1  ORF type:complete len:492 (-),score=90.66 TRINITY_DN1912_c0_g1_i1:201-1676(-)
MWKSSVCRPWPRQHRNIHRTGACLLLLALLCPLAFANRHKGPPVCVIGAGPGGIAAATELEGKGYPVVVLEKEDYIGGRTKSFRDANGNFNDVGAIIAANDYSNLLEVAKRVGIRVAPEPFERVFYDPITGQAVPQFNLSAQAGAAGAAAAVTALRNYVRLYSDWKLAQGEPAADYAMPMAQYLVANNMTALIPAALGMNYYGYGSISATPMVYMFRLLTASVMSNLILNPPIRYGTVQIPGGFQTLMQRWAATLKDVRLNIKIRTVNRKENGRSTIYYTVGNSKKEKKLRCRATVVAFPQYLPRLSFLNLDARETAIFSQVKLVAYASAVVDLGAQRARLAKGVSALYAADLNARGALTPPLAEPPGEGETVSFTIRKNFNYAIFYSWNNNFTQADASVIKKKMLSIAPQIVPFPSAPNNAAPLPASSIKAFYQWDYFPHVRQQSMASGFEKDLESLQGHRGTYWVGGLLVFDCVETTISGTKTVIEKHF